jgi:L-ectoine synthase
MILRSLDEIIGSEREVFAEDKSWVSRRLLLKKDNMGYSVHDTVVFAGEELNLHYKNHLESVYCIEGEGEIGFEGDDKFYPIKPGTIYALDKHDKHCLRAKTDMRFVCVFNPPVVGDEVHRADGSYVSD